MNTHNLKVDFGRHKGELYTRLPVSYLNWMVNSDHSKKDIAIAELKRRGTTMPTLELSGHAIDRFSERFLIVWNNERIDHEEGLHSWMLEAAAKALKEGKKLSEEKYKYLNITWVFDFGTCYPTLKTVM